MPSSRRLHRWSLLFLAGDSLRGLLLPLVAVAFTAQQSQWDLWIALFSVPVGVLSAWRYFTTFYELGADELVVRTGLLFRNERHIRYARIQNIEGVQGPLHRLLRVVDLRLETAGAAEQEARLRVLSVADAQEVRQRVLEGKRLAAAGGEAPAGGPPPTGEGPAPAAAGPRELVRVRTRDLVVLGLTQNRGGVLLGAAAGALWEANLLGSGWERPTAVLAPYLARLHDDGRLFTDPGPVHVALLAAGLLVVVAAIRLLSVAWTLVQLHGFTLARDGDELRTTRGLFTRVQATIPLGRVQLVTVRAPALMRLCGRVEVRVQTAGGDKHASGGREWLAPSLPAGLVDGLVAEVLPGVVCSEIDWRPADRRAAWRLRRSSLRWLALAIAALAILPGLRPLVLAATPPAVALLWITGGRRARALGHALLPGHFAARDGWWLRQASIAAYAKVQATGLCASPFDRRWDMAAITADTAGGGAHRLAAPYLGAEEAGRALEELRARVTAARFRW